MWHQYECQSSVDNLEWPHDSSIVSTRSNCSSWAWGDRSGDQQYTKSTKQVSSLALFNSQANAESGSANLNYLAESATRTVVTEYQISWYRCQGFPVQVACKGQTLSDESETCLCGIWCWWQDRQVEANLGVNQSIKENVCQSWI